VKRLPDPEAAARLAEATRRVIDVVRRSASAPETMREAADALLAIAARLEPDAHPGPFMQRDLVWEGVFSRPLEPPRDFADFFPYSPLVGPRNPIAPPIAFEVRGDRLHGRVEFGAAYVGPPQSVHGGIIAAAFDELLGSANLVNQVGGMTGTLTVRYREPTPIGKPIDLVGWVDRIDGRKVFTRGEMRHAGRLTAEAEGIFIGGSMEKLLAHAAA
jgi:acyl-coenzyme A thioesterase PaaI-like protein